MVNRGFDLNSKLDNSITTAYTKIPKLKTIYQDILNINNPNWNEETKTITQHELAAKLKNKLPYSRARSLLPIKGRDMIWRYLLKAIPKIHNDKCPFCDEYETSQHIFFTCKSIKQEVTTIINSIFKEYQITNHNWDEMIFNKLHSNIIGNVTAIAFEEIWYRRNQRKHNGYIHELSADKLIKKLKVIQGAVWNKEINIINKIIIKNINLDTNQQKENNTRITERLEKFNKEWNSKITSANFPQYLNPYLISPSSNQATPYTNLTTSGPTTTFTNNTQKS